MKSYYYYYDYLFLFFIFYFHYNIFFTCLNIYAWALMVGDSIDHGRDILTSILIIKNESSFWVLHVYIKNAVLVQIFLNLAVYVLSSVVQYIFVNDEHLNSRTLIRSKKKKIKLYVSIPYRFSNSYTPMRLVCKHREPYLALILKQIIAETTGFSMFVLSVMRLCSCRKSVHYQRVWWHGMRHSKSDAYGT